MIGVNIQASVALLDQNANPLDISMDHLPVFQLLVNADPVVKGVMLLLGIAALICWVIACEKLTRIVAFSQQVSALEGEGRFKLAHQPDAAHCGFGAVCEG